MCINYKFQAIKYCANTGQKIYAKFTYGSKAPVLQIYYV